MVTIVTIYMYVNDCMEPFSPEHFLPTAHGTKQVEGNLNFNEKQRCFLLFLKVERNIRVKIRGILNKIPSLIYFYILQTRLPMCVLVIYVLTGKIILVFE